MKSSQAQAAKLIRQELKQAFPGTKFSVTSQSFSMGCSIDIRWDNGPTSKQVESITGKYEYGHFDGMTDCYEISNRRNDIPQSKYVMEQRTVTEEMQNEAFEYIRYSWECLEGKMIDDSSVEINKDLGTWTARNFIDCQLAKIDLTNGLTKQKLEDVIFNRVKAA